MAADLTTDIFYTLPDILQPQSRPQPSPNPIVPQVISPASAGAYLSALGISYTEDGEVTTDPHLRRVDFSEVTNAVREFAAAAEPTWAFVADELVYQSNEADGGSISDEDSYEPFTSVVSSSDEEMESYEMLAEDADLSDEETTEAETSALSYTATLRYLCLVVVTDWRPEPGNPDVPKKEYVLSLEVKQDKPFTRHCIRLPHASITVHLRWDDGALEPQYQIRRAWQMPGHLHEMSIVHHNLVDMPCMGPCARRCSRTTSEVYQWVDENLRPWNEDSDDEVALE
ncbi:hypothetical protein CLAIMM_13230 [Cladophialophora immunda]|nr:hypothetical protein CLAIMM_13230 [Cladophialophora immunda]